MTLLIDVFNETKIDIFGYIVLFCAFLHLRRWPNINPALGERLVCAGMVLFTCRLVTYRPLDMKGCICLFTKWQMQPFISKGTVCATRVKLCPKHVQLTRCGTVVFHLCAE